MMKSVTDAELSSVPHHLAAEIGARALETAAEIRVDGLYGEPLHTWLYARAAFLRGLIK